MAQREKNDVIVFQVRTLMNTIVGMLDLIRHSNPTTEVVECVDIARRSADSAANLVSDYFAGRETKVTPEEPIANAASPEANPTQARSLAILVVEDNQINQKIISRVLGRRGHRVAVADNGIAALSVVGKQKFDLILMDMMMPEMDGVEAIRAIRDREATSGGHLPIVAMTALEKTDVAPELFDQIDGFLTKPFNPKQLDALLSEIASRS